MKVRIISLIKRIIRVKILINYMFIVFLLIFFSCTKTENPVQQSGLFHKTVMVEDLNRKYAIYIPGGIENKTVPLIFELHGGGIYIEDMTGESGYKTPYKLWMTLAEREKFIVVYPEGMDGKYNKPTWNDCRADCIVSSNADDVYFIETLINIISKNYQIDENRIYVSGTSNGGFMALRLAVEFGDRIAAVAAIAAAMPAVSDCNQPVKPISILFMNGTDDNHMPYYGGYVSNPPNPDYGSAMSTENSVKFWVNFNNTDTVPDTFVYPDIDTTDGGIVERFSYRNGVKETEVIFYKVNGAGHSAPSIQEQYSELFEQYFNKQNHDIEMTTEVWNFFKNKTLN
ncbi:MAG: alpha/beta hydrolase fold domain-containing protein [Bacteroidales bacterium]|nr:alpha/beta hydrolase fold domain-containing protein [Bacteroidales bacterium]